MSIESIITLPPRAIYSRNKNKIQHTLQSNKAAKEICVCIFGGKALFNAELYNTKQQEKKNNTKKRNQLHFWCLGIKAKESERYTISFSLAVQRFYQSNRNSGEDLQAICFILVLSL